MSAERIGCNYETMEGIAQAFGQHANEVRTLTGQIARCVDSLEHGDWVGQGANQFYAEMENVVFPALKKLDAALDSSQQQTQAIIALLHAAEDEAGRLFAPDENARNARRGGSPAKLMPLPSLLKHPGEVPEHFFDSRRRPFHFTKNGEAIMHKFIRRSPPHFVEEPALKYEIEVDGQRVTIITPALGHQLGYVPTVDEVAAAIAAMPPEARKHIKQVVIEPDPQETVKGKKGMIAAATSGGTIRFLPNSYKHHQGQLDATIIHEGGHALSTATFGAWNAKQPTAGWNQWLEASRKDNRTVSDYGTTDPTEDFSEMYVVYNRVKGTPDEAKFKAAYPNRWALMERVIQQNR